jgi:hypothetical protein
MHFVATKVCLDRSIKLKLVFSELLVSTVHYLPVADDYTLVSNTRPLRPRHVVLEIYQAYQEDSTEMFLS